MRLYKYLFLAWYYGVKARWYRVIVMSIIKSEIRAAQAELNKAMLESVKWKIANARFQALVTQYVKLVRLPL
jgi:hypothetical protein